MMEHQLAPSGAVAAPGVGGLLAGLRDLLALTKPRITSLVLVTTAGGMWLAPGRPPLWVMLLTLIEVAAVVAAACVFNCWLERDIDAMMRRTKDRPLAAGRISPRLALALGFVLAAGGLPALALMVNGLTALLTGLALLLYVGVYTPMKRRSSDALLVGAVPGALPPLIGWTASTGNIELGGVVLFALMFVWQLPHFLAISLYLQEDYARGGIKVLPLERGDAVARRHLVGWSVAQLAVSLLLVPLGIAGPIYATVALLAGVAYLVVAARGLRVEKADVPRWARRMMLTSIAYLGLVFAALAVDAA